MLSTKNTKTVETNLAEVRHDLKNYLNMLTLAEFELYGDSNVTRAMAEYIDNNLTATNLFKKRKQEGIPQGR